MTIKNKKDMFLLYLQSRKYNLFQKQQNTACD